MAASFAIIPISFKPNLLLRRQPKRTICATTSNQSYFSSANADISSHLLRSLPTTLHPSITSPIHHILSSSSTPPTIAPPLCLAASELVGGNSNSALNTACALHLIHLAIHAHTSLLIPKSPAEFSLGKELMTGDGLLCLAFEMVAQTPADDAEADMRLLKVLIEVTTAAAAAVAVVDEEEREGKLAACAAACGVMLGGGNEEEVEKARRLGMLVGKMELDVAEVELTESGFEEVKAGSVRRLLHHMLLTRRLSK